MEEIGVETMCQYLFISHLRALQLSFTAAVQFHLFSMESHMCEKVTWGLVVKSSNDIIQHSFMENTEC